MYSISNSTAPRYVPHLLCPRCQESPCVDMSSSGLAHQDMHSSILPHRNLPWERMVTEVILPAWRIRLSAFVFILLDWLHFFHVRQFGWKYTPGTYPAITHVILSSTCLRPGKSHPSQHHGSLGAHLQIIVQQTDGVECAASNF